MPHRCIAHIRSCTVPYCNSLSGQDLRQILGERLAKESSRIRVCIYLTTQTRQSCTLPLLKQTGGTAQQAESNHAKTTLHLLFFPRLYAVTAGSRLTAAHTHPKSPSPLLSPVNETNASTQTFKHTDGAACVIAVGPSPSLDASAARSRLTAPQYSSSPSPLLTSPPSNSSFFLLRFLLGSVSNLMLCDIPFAGGTHNHLSLIPPNRSFPTLTNEALRCLHVKAGMQLAWKVLCERAFLSTSQCSDKVRHTTLLIMACSTPL